MLFCLADIGLCSLSVCPATGELIDEVFQAATKPGALESFGWPQQNTITQWSESLRVSVGDVCGWCEGDE